MNYQEIAKKKLSDKNVITLDLTEEQKKLSEIYHYVLSVLITNVQLKRRIEDSNIVYLFIFDMNAENQNKKITNADGVSIEFSEAGKRINSIGISTNCIKNGEAYTKEMILHEITHAAYRPELRKERERTGKDHTELFETMLNQMLELYNRTTGEHLINHMNGYYEI